MYLRVLGLAAAMGSLSACAVPQFDTKYDEKGPTVATIIERIECELVTLIKSDDPKKYGYDQLLAGFDYVATMTLTLKVTDTGELAPSLKFPTVGPAISIGGGLKLSRTRSHSFTQKMRYSFKELRESWLRDKKGEFGQCPKGENYDLRGRLGIEKLVALHFSAPTGLTSEPVNVKGNRGEFGGTITFTLLRNINSAGPTWTFSDFSGPGGLAKLERSSVNTLDIAFAIGSTELDKRTGKATSIDTVDADNFLTEILLLDIDR